MCAYKLSDLNWERDVFTLKELISDSSLKHRHVLAYLYSGKDFKLNSGHTIRMDGSGNAFFLGKSYSSNEPIDDEHGEECIISFITDNDLNGIIKDEKIDTAYYDEIRINAAYTLYHMEKSIQSLRRRGVVNG